MNFFKMKRHKISSILALGALPFVASAATQSFDGVFSWVGSGSDSVTLSQFDSSLGTLTSVNVEITTAKTGGKGQADNDSAVSGSVTFTQKVDVVVTSLDVNLNNLVFSTDWASLTATSSSGSQALSATTGDDTGSFNNTGLGDYTEWNATDANDADAGEINSAVWASGLTGYEGTGSFDLLANGTQSTSTSGLGGVQTAQVVSTVSGTAKVTYTYTVVPEPATYALLAGLFAFSWIAIRRRK